MAVTTSWTVEGMTCSHCVAAVDEEVRRLEGVSSVAIELGSGEVRVTSDEPIPVDAMAAAVDEAGYELVRT